MIVHSVYARKIHILYRTIFDGTILRSRMYSLLIQSGPPGDISLADSSDHRFALNRVLKRTFIFKLKNANEL